MVYGGQRQLGLLGPFLGGWNLKDDPFRVGKNQVIDGRNVTLSADGYLTPCPGTVGVDKVKSVAYSGYGLFRAYKSDGTSYLLKAAGTRIWYADADDNNIFKALTLQSGLTLTENLRTRFEVYNDVVYITNGTDAAMKWNFNPADAVCRVGIDAPVSAATFDSNIDGDLAEGNYYYKYTYYNSTYGTESGLSPVSAVMAALASANDGIKIAIPANGNVDGQVDKVRVYRTEVSGDLTDSYMYAGEADYTGEATTYSDTTADGSLGTVVDDLRDVPPDGAAFVLTSNNMLFLAGIGAYPNRLYYSRIGYPEYYTGETTGLVQYLNVGRSEGDKITGIMVRHGFIYIFKESSIWKLSSPHNPEELNLDEVTTAYGCVAPDSISQDEKFMYFVCHEGVAVLDGNEQVFLISGNIDKIFKGVGENSIPRMMLRYTSGQYHENRYLLSYTTKRGIEGGSTAAVKTSESVATTGSNRATASIDADGEAGNLQSGDAVYSLTQSQSDLNRWLKITLYIPWDTDNIAEAVQYRLFVSYDNRTTWTQKQEETLSFIRDYNFTARGPGQYDLSLGGYYVAPDFTPTIELFDKGVTDVRLDLIGSAKWFVEDGSNPRVVINQNLDPNSAGYNPGPTSIQLRSVSYYYDSISGDVSPDRTLCFHTNMIEWDPLLKRFTGVVDPPWEIGTRMWCVASGGADQNEVYYIDPATGRVFQLVDGEITRDGKAFLSWFRTGNIWMGSKVKVNQVKVDRLPSGGNSTVEVYIDNIEKAQEELNFSGGGPIFGQVEYGSEAFASVGIIENGVELGGNAIGKYISLRIWSQDGSLGNIIGIRPWGVRLPDRA